MHLRIALCAYFRVAPRTLRELAALIAVNMRWLYPFSAFRHRTVDSVLRVVLLILPIPEHLEVEIE